MTDRLDEIRYGDLRACRCGCETPVRGWFGPPETHYVHCPSCGDWTEGDQEDALTMQWNRRSAPQRKAA